MSLPPPSQTPNPGGDLPPEQVIGRNAEIERLWQALETRSLVLTAPRRMGKTSVWKRMEKEEHPGFRLRYTSLERVPRELPDFVQAVLEQIDGLTGGFLRRYNPFARFVERLAGGIELKGVKVALRLPGADWQVVLDHAWEGLQRWADEQERVVVLVWDELTIYLDGLIKQRGDADAVALLDYLRDAQRWPRVRMVYTGSIGLHELLRGLKSRGYTNDPDNKMAREVLDVLAPAEARELARRLVASFETEAANADALSTHLARISEGHPFVLQHIADRLRMGQIRTIYAADQALAGLLDSDQDPLELEHYVERLRCTLSPVDRELVIGILDRLSASSTGTQLAELRAGFPEERLVELLQWLRRDQYVQREGERWSFRLEVLRRFWRSHRMLS